MRGFATKAASTLATLVASMVLLFALTMMIPGDLASIMLGPNATPETIAAFAHHMGLDQSLPVRLGRFFALLLSGDFGNDIVSGRPIARMILDVLPYTVTLAATAIGLALLLGIPAGVLAALRPGSIADRALGLIEIAFIALPNFVVALALLLVFSLALHWLPVEGGGEAGNPADQARHLVLPAIAVALGWIGYIARLVRAALFEVLNTGYIRTARAYGLPKRIVIMSYALRPVAIPILAVLGVGIGRLLGGAVFAEIIFARPGLGTLIFSAISQRNYPVVQASVFVIMVLFVGTNLIVDALFLWLDPRLRRQPT